MKLDIEILNKYFEDKKLFKKEHPEHDLIIWNYTRNTQFNNLWDNITRVCRGIITSSDGTIVSRSLPKFYNLNEPENKGVIIDYDECEYYLKYDGYFGISYFIDGKMYIASKGNFASKYSDFANIILNEKYSHLLDNIDQSKTYMFEIINPVWNIVVSYYYKDIILFAVVDTETGEESDISTFGFNHAKKLTLEDVSNLDVESNEGYILKRKDNYRIKFKFDEYIKKHRLVTYVSSYNIYENYINGNDIEKILGKIPDEVFNFVKDVISEIKRNYTELHNKASKEYMYIINNKHIYDTKRKIAEYVKTLPNRDLVFALLNNKNIDKSIYSKIKPEYMTPFDVEKKEQELIITVGYPASGKSTWSKNKVLEHYKYVIVNKDSIRTMFKGNYSAFQHGSELDIEVHFICENMVNNLLYKGYSVIVDSTGFDWDDAKILEYKEKYSELIVSKKYFTDISIEECIERDKKREITIGEDVIREMYKGFENKKI